MATQVEAARLLTLRAARLKDAGERSDMEAGMAKLFASEAGRFCVEESFRIHGGYGYSKEYEIERLYRDAPLLLIGEGTSEIQRMVIGKKLLQRHKICSSRISRRLGHPRAGAVPPAQHLVGVPHASAIFRWRWRFVTAAAARSARDCGPDRPADGVAGTGARLVLRTSGRTRGHLRADPGDGDDRRRARVRDRRTPAGSP